MAPRSRVRVKGQKACKTCKRKPDEVEFYALPTSRQSMHECKECMKDRARYNKDKNHPARKAWVSERRSETHKHWGYSEFAKQWVTREKKLRGPRREREASFNRSRTLFEAFQRRRLRRLVGAAILVSFPDEVEEAHVAACEAWAEEKKRRKREGDRAYRERKRKDSEWLEKENERQRQKEQARPTKKKGNGPRIHKTLVWAKSIGICGICKEPVDPNWWVADHIVPVALGGDNSISNLQVAHMACNLFKGDKHPLELPPVMWFREQRAKWEAQDWVQENIKNGVWDKATCGTESAYSGGCRCDDCKRGHAAYAADLRTRKKLLTSQEEALAKAKALTEALNATGEYR